MFTGRKKIVYVIFIMLMIRLQDSWRAVYYGTRHCEWQLDLRSVVIQVLCHNIQLSNYRVISMYPVLSLDGTGPHITRLQSSLAASGLAYSTHNCQRHLWNPLTWISIISLSNYSPHPVLWCMEAFCSNRNPEHSPVLTTSVLPHQYSGFSFLCPPTRDNNDELIWIWLQNVFMFDSVQSNDSIQWLFL